MKVALFYLLISSLTTALAHQATGRPQPFNEVMGSDGRMNAAYREFITRSGQDPYPVRSEIANQLLGMPLNDAIKILPIPAILGDDEYRILQDGAQWRAKALTTFFADVVFNGGSKAIASGLLTSEQIEAIFLSESGTFRLKYLRDIWSQRSVRDIHFVYGPDIVRNPRGEFRVLEDNIGHIGGVGDVAAIHNAFFRSHHLRPPILKAVETFLSDLPRAEWSERAVVIFQVPKKSENIKPEDAEDRRVSEALQSLGIKILDVSSLESGNQELKKIINGDYKKVINIYQIFDFKDYPPMVDVLDAFKNKKIDLFSVPGIEAMSSKAMLPYVDRLSEIYLGRSPLETQNSKWVTSSADLKDLRSGWVVKRSNGKQGSEIYILDQLSEDGRENLIHGIRAWEAYDRLHVQHAIPRFMMQEHVDPSYIPAEIPNSWVRFNVDFRPHVFVIGGIPLAPVIWGRANWKIPGFLNNVSQNAMELVVATPSHCERSLM